MEGTRESPDVKSVFRLYEENTHHLLTDRVTFIFLELDKFQKTLEELDGNILEGMYFCFKNMPTLSERPDVLSHEVFKKIFDSTELLNMDSVTRSKVLDKMTTERDLRNQIRYLKETAIAEGRAEGHAEGHAEGRHAKAVEIALKLISNGMSKEEASEFVGIDVQDLDKAE